MVPVSYFDDRPGMQSKFNAILGCVMHLALSVFCSAASTWLVMILYGVEVLTIMSIVFIQRARYRR